MQLLRQLTEQADHQQEVVDLIALVKQAKPFFDQRAHEVVWFFRGVKSAELPTAMGGVVTPRTDRRPVDTTLKFHEMLDDRLYQDFGFRYRSGATFVTGSRQGSGDYGFPCIVLPLGPFELVYGEECTDAYGHFRGRQLKEYLENNAHSVNLQLAGMPNEVSTRQGEEALTQWCESKPEATKLMNDWFERQYAMCKYKKGSVVEACLSGREIMLHSPKNAIIPFRRNVHPDTIGYVERAISDRLHLDLEDGYPSTGQLIQLMLPHIFK